MRDDGHDDHRQEHEPDREEPYRPEIRAQILERGEEGGAVEERRQDADEDEVGRQVDLRQAGREAECEPAEDEQDRIRDPKLRDEHQHPCHRRQEHQQAEEVVVVEVDQARPLARSSPSARSDFSSSSPMPRRISGVFVNWMSE